MNTSVISAVAISLGFINKNMRIYLTEMESKITLTFI